MINYGQMHDRNGNSREGGVDVDGVSTDVRLAVAAYNKAQADCDAVVKNIILSRGVKADQDAVQTAIDAEVAAFDELAAALGLFQEEA